MSNTTKTLLAQILACPSGNGPLEVRNGQLYSPQLSIEFPEALGVPWMYHDPHVQLAQWRMKIKGVVDYYKSQALRAENESRKADLLKTTKNKLELLQNAYMESAQDFANLLQPLLETSTPSHPVEKIFFEKVPRQQTVMAYHQTVFRDWVWGQNEIKNQVDLLLPHLKSTKKLLVLGAGASGLPYQIHQTLGLAQTLAVDINPILLFIAKRLMSGENLSLTEYPTVPLDLSSTAIRHSISKIQPADNFHFLFADAQSLNLKPGAFDTILTPWFIDIVPRNFRELARHLNQHLEKGGRWLNIGQLGFERNQLSEVLTKEEILEALTEAGFQVEVAKHQPLPYLQSPHNMMGRQDQIFMFSAVKERQAKKPAQFFYLPDWLRDWNLPIPPLQEIQNFQMKANIYAQTVNMVNGQTSLDQIAQAYAKQFQMNPQDARDALYTFFLNIYEQMIFREF